MAISKAGYILALIGGIIGVLTGLVFALLGGFIASLASAGAAPDATVGGGVFVGIGIYVIITSIIVIVGSVWMKNPEKCRKGSIITIIFSVIGGGGILGIIGGILGIVASGKEDSVAAKAPKSK